MTNISKLKLHPHPLDVFFAISVKADTNSAQLLIHLDQNGRPITELAIGKH